MKKIVAILFSTCLLGSKVSAQDIVTGHSEDLTLNTPFKKSYFSTGMEGMIFSSAMMERPGKESHLSTLRFTAFLHLGTYWHYNFNRRAGMFTGLSLKNIGFIDKYETLDSTVKRRLYTLNLPVALKFGNMSPNKFFFVGGEVSLALNYREKGFVKRNDKVKFNEWFSDRTPLIMPNIFAGYQHNNFYIKFSYYPSNFMNTDFVDAQGARPYDGYNVNLFAVTMGMSTPQRPLFD